MVLFLFVLDLLLQALFYTREIIHYIGSVIVSSLQFSAELIQGINWSAIVHYIKIACVETGNVTLYSIELAYNVLFSIVATLWTVLGYFLVGIIYTLYTALSYLIVGVNTLISHSIYILTTSLNLLAHGIQHILGIFSSIGLTQDTLKSIVVNCIVIGTITVIVIFVYLDLRRRINRFRRYRNRRNRNRERGSETSNNFDGYQSHQRGQSTLHQRVLNTAGLSSDRSVSTDNSQEASNMAVIAALGESVEMQAKLRLLERELEKEVDSKQCVVCLDKPRELMIRPCNHYCVCRNCRRKINKCPMCTRWISSTEKVYNA